MRSAYAQAWRENFAQRMHIAAFFAHLFMQPASARIATALLERLPHLLTMGARWSGKIDPVYTDYAYTLDAVRGFIRDLPASTAVAVYSFSRNMHRVAPL